METDKITIENILSNPSVFDVFAVIAAIRNRSDKELSAYELESLLNKYESYFTEKIKKLTGIEKKAYLYKLDDLVVSVSFKLQMNFEHLLPHHDITSSLKFFYQEFINRTISIIKANIENEQEKDELENIKLPESGSTKLNVEETALLFMLMREHCLIDPEINKNVLSTIISKLTGFGASNMKISLTRVESKGQYRIDQNYTINNLSNKINQLLFKLNELKKTN